MRCFSFLHSSLSRRTIRRSCSKRLQHWRLLAAIARRVAHLPTPGLGPGYKDRFVSLDFPLSVFSCYSKHFTSSGHFVEAYSFVCSMVKLLRGHRTPSPAYCARLVLALAIPLCSTEPAAASGRHPRGCLSRLPGWRWPLLQEREALAPSPRFGLPDCVDPRGRPTVRSNCTSPLPSFHTDRRR